MILATILPISLLPSRDFELLPPPSTGTKTNVVLATVLATEAVLVGHFFVYGILLRDGVFPIYCERVVIFVLALLGNRYGELRQSGTVCFRAEPISLFSVFMRSYSYTSRRGQLRWDLAGTI